MLIYRGFRASEGHHWINGLTPQHMTPNLPLGHESLDLELEAEWRFRAIHIKKLIA